MCTSLQEMFEFECRWKAEYHNRQGSSHRLVNAPRYDIFQFQFDRLVLVCGSLTKGKIINIMSVDVNRCDRILLPFSNISVSPILVPIAIWQIYVRMGNAIWGALGTTIFFLLCNIGQDRVQNRWKPGTGIHGPIGPNWFEALKILSILNWISNLEIR